MKLVCFHGSPGSPEEFLPLERELGRVSSRLKLERIRRPGYGAASAPELRGKVVLGYSWGAAEALLSVLDSHAPIAGFVFVAPYLFPQKKLGAGMRALLRTPGLSSFLLSKIADKTIDQFLEKSSAPCPTPEGYRKLAETLKTPSVLRTAALEKEAKQERIMRALRVLAAKGGGSNCPVALIWGAQDQVSNESTQIEPLRKIFPWIREIRIENAGHALQWTHAPELASAIVEIFENGVKRV